MHAKRRIPLFIGTLLSAGTVMITGTAKASDAITAVSWGGVYQDALRNSFFTPAAEKMEIEIREDTLSGIADVRLQVLSRAVSWDIIELASSSCVAGAAEGLFEPLDYDVIDVSGFPEGTYGEHWIGSMFYSTVLAWNTEKYADNPPTGWADFFDTENFPGSRSMYNSTNGTLEFALLADGVAAEDLYPLDVDRAFDQLREIRDDVAIWWTSGAQTTQLAKDGEVDMIAAWSSRIDQAMADGANYDYTFNEGMLDFGCFAIPKGSENVEAAMQALAHFATADLQANLPAHINYGPVNAAAFDTGKIDPAVAEGLNSAPENLPKQFVAGVNWIAENAPQMRERWDEFLTE